MRFHHSTRRGKSRLGQYSRQQASSRFPQHSFASTSRWSQLGYCRETNIHFNRRLPIEPVELDPPGGSRAPDTGLGLVQPEPERFDMANPSARDTTNRRSARAKQTASDNGQGRKQQQIDERFHRLSLRGTKRVEDIKDGRQGSTDTPEQQVGTGSLVSAQEGSHKKLDMESIRAKLVAQVEKHPFWSNKAARKMQLTGLEERRVYIYELTSYHERRELEWRYEPYKGGLAGSTAPFKRTLVAETPSTHLATPVRSSLCATGSSLRSTVPRAPLSSQSIPKSSPASPTATTGSRDSFWTGSVAVSGGSGVVASRSTASPQGRSSQAGSMKRSSSGNATIRATSPRRTLDCDPIGAIDRPTPSPELIWSIEVPVRLQPEPFVGYVHSTELANSSFVKRCHGCQGRGRLKCASCYGVGYEVCISCSGKGTTRNLSASGASGSSNRYGRSYGVSDHEYHSRQSSSANPDDADSSSAFSQVDSGARGRGAGEPGGITLSGSAWVSDTCHNCHGAGQKRCWACAGKSYNHCHGCLGSGQLRCYLNLSITWANHRDESTLNNSDNIVPKDRLKLSTGLLLADEIGDRLKPLKCDHIDGATGQRLDETNQLFLASKRLLEKHNQTYKQEKLLQQRHRVTQIECYVINYEWKQRRGHFVIHGDERKVYIAKYPFKSLCSIT